MDEKRYDKIYKEVESYISAKKMSLDIVFDGMEVSKIKIKHIT